VQVRSQERTTEHASLNVGATSFAIVGVNRSLLYAAHWLAKFGCTLTGAESIAKACASPKPPLAVIAAGDSVQVDETIDSKCPIIYLWDFETGVPGPGEFACAVSGVSTVIGQSNGPPGVMPARIPEKWVGLFGASLALSLKVASTSRAPSLPKRIDVSAADVLRAYAEQNSGNHAGVPYGWRRNGRTAVEHGGVFPQGFFRCRDGFMAIQARSRPDWHAILAALDNPAWSSEPHLQNPFKLSENDAEILPLLDEELMKHDRRSLLERAAITGAPIAPVLPLSEAIDWNVFRDGFVSEDGRLGLPFTVRRCT
jgi:hypothetical protein